MTNEPKKCPFCGHEAVVVGFPGAYHAFCPTPKVCGFQSPVRPTEKEAIEAWNSIQVVTEEDKLMDRLGFKQEPDP